jgi:hypothetical protein
MQRSKEGSSGAVKKLISWQLMKLVDTLLDAVRLVIVLAAIGVGIWLYFGKPDISWLFTVKPVPETKAALPVKIPALPETGISPEEPKAGIYSEPPLDLGNG